MDNLLPRFPFDLNEKKESKTKQWNSLKAYPNTSNNNTTSSIISLSNNPLYYDSITTATNKTPYTVFKPILGPNQRYDRTPLYNSTTDISPLSLEDPTNNFDTNNARIVLPQSLVDYINEKEHKKYTKSNSYLNTFNIFISVLTYSISPTTITNSISTTTGTTTTDMFIKIGSNIQYYTIHSNRTYLKFVAGNRNASVSSASTDTTIYILASPANKVTIYNHHHHYSHHYYHYQGYSEYDWTSRNQDVSIQYRPYWYGSRSS